MGNIMNDTAVDLWFGGLSVTSFDGNTIVFDTDEEMKVNIINEKYRSEIERRFTENLGFPVTVEMHFTGTPVSGASMARALRGITPPEEKKPEQEKTGIGSTIPPFNFDYTFDNFIVGSSNKFAHAACVAVADRPAMDFNPLFIYGPSGIGKTHLLYAITNEMKKKKHDISVIYIKGEDFTNQMIESLSRQAMKEFRDRYRLCDILMIDDIQFIAGKVATQEEFFHTFNALQTQGKQIILTSDKPPKEMETLEERIRSRFEWGLMADIGVPDYETRMAILRKKAESDNFDIDDEVLSYIANNIKSNVRELEGALNKLLAYNNLVHIPITMDIAEKELSNIITPDKPREITPQLIIEVVSEHYHISVDQMISKTRSSDVAKPRQIAMYLCKNMTESPLDTIGSLLGGRDHSTIIHGIKKVTEEYEKNETTRNMIETIKKKINPN